MKEKGKIMNKYDYDVIVIGGGTAGLGAYRKAKSLGKKALIIEANDFVTTCANVGCMPSKLLIAAADNMESIHKSSLFGIEVSDVKINNEVLWNRIRSERDRFVGFVKKGAEKIDEKDRMIGFAKFTKPHEIEIDGKKMTSEVFVIATGSRPIYLDIFNDIKNEVLTNENIFELKQVPSSIAVFGAGVIGLELGFALKNLGSQVQLFSRGKNLLRLNSDINEYLVNHINSSMDFEYEESVTKIEKENGGYRLYWGDKNQWFEKILVAIGRKANIDSIGLENWIEGNVLSMFDRNTMQIGSYPIFLAGDVNNDVTLLHEAAKEGVIAGENAANYPEVKQYKRNVGLGVVFSSPQIMQVGKTVDLPIDVIKGTVSFEDQGRSRVMLQNKGMLNVYFDRATHLLIGSEMIGPSAEHVAHMLAWLIEKNTTLEEILEFPFYHPVIEEGVRTAIRDAATKV